MSRTGFHKELAVSYRRVEVQDSGDFPVVHRRADLDKVPVEDRAEQVPVKHRADWLPLEGRAEQVPVEDRAEQVLVEGRAEELG